MKITLYNPPNWYYSEQKDLGRIYPSLSLPLIAKVLKRAGHVVNVLDLEALACRPQDIIPSGQDIIGFNVILANKRGAYECIKQLREKGYKSLIVTGGNHATHAPQESLDAGADLVITGECEGNIVQLLETTGIQAGQGVAIEDIPIPDWDCHSPSIDTYKGHTKFLEKPAVTMWTRGCPFSCIFCGNNIFGRRATKYRPVENITAEMQYLKDRWGFRSAYVYDDELIGTHHPEGWIDGLVERIGPMRYNLAAQGRCSERYITPGLMKRIKQIGVNVVFWGVESLCNETLKNINKKTTTDDIFHSLKVSKEAGIKNAVFFQVGNYRETEEQVQETYQNLNKLKEYTDEFRVFITQVRDGTLLAEIAKAEGWYKPLPEGWRTQRETNLDTPWMKRERIEYWQAKYYEAVK